MKKQNLFKRIISIIFIVLILLFVPVTGFIQGKNNLVYAVDIEIIDKVGESIIPAVALMTITMKNVEQTAENIANEIDDIKQNFSNYYKTLSNEKKLVIATSLSDYSLRDLNYVYGTSVSESTLTSIGVYELKQKIQENQALSLYDFHKLGINDITAQALKNYMNPYIDYGETFAYKDYSVNIRQIQGRNFYVADLSDRYNLFDNFPLPLRGKQEIKHYYDDFKQLSWLEAYYEFNSNETYYKITYTLHLGNILTVEQSNQTMTDQNIIGLTTAPYFGYYAGTPDSTVRIYKLVDNSWVSQYEGFITNRTIFRDLITLLSTIVPGFTSNNIPNYSNATFVNSTNITAEFPLKTFQYDESYSIPALTGGIFIDTGAPDTSLTAAERVIANRDAADALGIQDLPYEVETNTNLNTGEKEISIIPGVPDIPVSDTSNPSVDIPDTSGDTNVNPDTGKGTINIPILGSILAWLKSLVELVRRILEQLLNNPGSQSDEGIDWGNFKGLFDLFFIFYYLIVIAILLLIKFLAVVMNILSIPPNTVLFNSYPTILQGINYLKGLKIGGFTVTMQQIFEYMFMIFFFIYIVTTLQKLYHSFTGVERQELRNNQRDIQIDRTSFSNESQPDYYSSWTGWAGYKNTGFTYTQEDNKNYSSQNGFIKETEHGIIKEFHGDKLLNDNLENIKVVHYVSKNKNSGGND